MAVPASRLPGICRQGKNYTNAVECDSPLPARSARRRCRGDSQGRLDYVLAAGRIDKFAADRYGRSMAQPVSPIPASPSPAIGDRTGDAPLPRRVLYATSARIGGTGLDLVAHKTLLAPLRAGFLGCAIGYDNRTAGDIPDRFVRSLRWSPVRLLSSLSRPFYYGAKKQYLDRVAARELGTGRYDFFHGWSGDALFALREARARGIPSMLEIPTWHVAHGFGKWTDTAPPTRLLDHAIPRAWRDRLLVTEKRIIEEYALTDLILSRSSRATETFLAEGIAPEKVFYIGDAADTMRFQPPADPPVDGIFRAIFVGALIRRKGVHHLLEAWHRLQLPRAELLLVGFPHPEIAPDLARHGVGQPDSTVRLIGPTPRVEDWFRQATVHIFPSLLEGCAKSTCEAAACGLPQITTRESGDVVVHGSNGLTVPPDDVDALTAAIETLYRLPAARLVEMRIAARRRAVEEFSWERFHDRILEAYRRAGQNQRQRTTGA